MVHDDDFQLKVEERGEISALIILLTNPSEDGEKSKNVSPYGSEIVSIDRRIVAERNDARFGGDGDD